MSLEDLKTLLLELNIPVAYSHFLKATEPPFITYRVDHTENFFGDNKTYEKIEVIYIELYTTIKDKVLEEQLENLFDENEISWEMESEDYISDEKVYQRIYRI